MLFRWPNQTVSTLLNRLNLKSNYWTSHQFQAFRMFPKQNCQNPKPNQRKSKRRMKWLNWQHGHPKKILNFRFRIILFPFPTSGCSKIRFAKSLKQNLRKSQKKRKMINIKHGHPKSFSTSGIKQLFYFRFLIFTLPFPVSGCLKKSKANGLNWHHGQL